MDDRRFGQRPSNGKSQGKRMGRNEKGGRRDARGDTPPRPGSASVPAGLRLAGRILGCLLLLLGMTLEGRLAYGFRPPFSANSEPLSVTGQIYDPMLKNTERLASYPADAKGTPYGHIMAPRSGLQNSRVIEITGMTANIPEDRYVLLAVDVETQWICFPKWPRIAANTAFHTELYEGCPNGACAVSLYAVDEAHFQKIKQWLNQERTDGMPLIPSRYRLDRIRLVMGVR
jgi:hypothetical protein